MSRIASVQETEPVLATLDMKLWKRLAVHDVGVTKITVVVKRIEEHRSIGIKRPILNHNRDVIWITGKDILTDEIQLQIILVQIESGQAVKHGLSRDIHSMIMVPARGRALRNIRHTVQQRDRVGVKVISCLAWQDVEIRVTIRVTWIMTTMQVCG